MTERSRVDLERMGAVYERERDALAQADADQRARIVRAQPLTSRRPRCSTCSSAWRPDC